MHFDQNHTSRRVVGGHSSRACADSRPTRPKPGCFCYTEEEGAGIFEGLHRGRELYIFSPPRISAKCQATRFRKSRAAGFGSDHTVTPLQKSDKAKRRGLRAVNILRFFVFFLRFIQIVRGRDTWCMCLEWDTLKVLTPFYFTTS